VTTCFLGPVAGFGGGRRLRQKTSSPMPGSRGVPLAAGGGIHPSPILVTCYVSLYHSLVKGESHAPVFVLRSHALIPTGAHSRPAALPKPIIISVPKPHCCKGSASKPYVEFPPHTAPLGMGVGPAQACAVKVVVHDLSLAIIDVDCRFALPGSSYIRPYARSPGAFWGRLRYLIDAERAINPQRKRKRKGAGHFRGVAPHPSKSTSSHIN
jgi:hypothetical protein